MFVYRLLRAVNVPRTLLSAVVLAALTFILSVQGSVQAAGLISGIVFRDYNANGVQDAREPGVGNVNVIAYDSTGAAVGTGISSNVTATLGQYSFNAATNDVTVRVEFATPTGFQTGAFGTGSGTSVQFISVPGTANYGVNIPSQYCQAAANLNLTTSCFTFGDQTGSGANAIITNPYNGGAETVHATAGQVGTVYGLAFQRPNATFVQGRTFAASYSKRLAGYGPNGPGAIYSVPMDGAGGAAPALFVNLAAGTDTHSAYTQLEGQLDTGAGADQYPSATSPYALVGKTALGDIDISEDGSTLFVVNLFDRSLYSIDVATAAVTNRGLIPSPACANGVGRPFALGIRDGIVFVGGVCSAELAGGISANLSAYVYTFTIAGGFSAAPVINFPLNYPRGCGDVFNTYQAGGVATICRTGTQGSLAEWQPWSDTWPNPQAAGGTGETDGFFAHAQPMLSDIEFDNGDMVLGFRDRQADQTGWDDAKPGLGILAAGQNLFTISAGDILRASPNGAGGWTIENNAQSNPAGTFGPSGGANNEQGPGNGEFYFQDNFAGAGEHDEILNGGLTQVPGYADVAATVMDPLVLVSGGVAKFNNTGGSSPNRYEIYQGGNPNFGKANGLGDLEPLCNAAPIEIGNYVWIDTDNDGIQDSNELPLAGVQVQLFNPGTNTVIATATTDGQGRYIFSSNPAGATTANFIYNLPILPSTAYQVRIDTTQGTLAGYTPSPANVGAPVNIVRDSNGQTGITAGFVVAPVTTGTAGQNDHTIDFGFTIPPMSLGNHVWYDIGTGGTVPNDGIRNVGEIGVANVAVSLYQDANNDGAPDGAAIRTDTTDNNGYYLFDGLAPGRYIVGINAGNFVAGQPLFGFLSSTPTFADNVDRNDNGINNVAPATNGILSNSILLTSGATPVGETDLSGNAADGPAFRGNNGETDNNSDLTIDFGFYAPMSLGNRVWADNGAGGGIANDGVQNGTEPGIANVNVSLYADADNNGVPDGAALATEPTDAGGYYLFDNLQPGRYIVAVDAANFNAGQVLEGLGSSTPTFANNTDQNDNGINTLTAQGILSNSVLLTVLATPINEADLSNNAGDGPAFRGNNGETDNNSDLTIDFGFFTTMSLGNRVWLDLGTGAGGVFDDGIQNGTEAGIFNVAVSLYLDADNNGVPDGAAIRTDTTDANGYYLFDGLAPGRYIVGVDSANFIGAGVLVGMASSAPNFANNVDQNDNGINATAPQPILSNSVLLTPNAAPVGEGDLSNNVADGPAFRGNFGETDNNSDLTIDFGFVIPMSIGNRVWFDVGIGAGGVRNDGIQNGTEPGAAGVVMSLYQDADNDGVPDGAAIATDTTDANGYYLFSNLPPGRYIVGVDAANFGAGQPLAGVLSSTPTFADNVDRNDNGINDATPAVNGILSNSVLLTANGAPVGEADLSNNAADGPAFRGNNGETDNNSDLTIDFGFVAPPMSLGNRVWLDLGIGGGGVFNDGIQNGTEAGVAGVVVSLYQDANNDGAPDGAALATDTTDINGYYLFENLAPGRYVVGVDVANFGAGQPLLNFVSSTPTFADNVDGNDNGINVAVAQGIVSNSVLLTTDNTPINEADLSNNAADGPAFRGNFGETDANSDLTIDFGFIIPMSIGNRVWFDVGTGAGGVRNDGIQNGTEPGVAGVAVSLFADANNDGVPDGAALTTENTDANGFYLFDNLPPGRYIVGVDAANFGAGQPLAGVLSSTPTFADNVDRNDNGINDATPAVNGILSNSILLTANGAPVGEADLSGNVVNDGPNSRGLNGETDNNSDLTIDFGFVAPPMSLGNRVWLDLGSGAGGVFNDGIQNGTEPGVAGVAVSLYQDANNDGTPDGAALATELTDTNGYYLFDNLAPGRYVVGVDVANFGAGQPLLNFVSSTPTFANNVDGNDNGINVAVAQGILSNSVLLTTNNTPIGETDLSNNLLDGVNFRGNNGETDNNSDLTIDFGFIIPMSIGNRVWFDVGTGAGGVRNDGIQNGTEPGVAGVAVSLFADANNDGAPDGAALATENTDANGFYLFDNLSPGRYVVGIDAANFGAGQPLDSVVSSTPTFADNVDRNDNGINNATPAVNGILSNSILLTANAAPINEADLSGNVVNDGPNSRGLNGETDNNSDLTIDFGFVAPPMSLGNRVWLDLGSGAGGVFNDGIQNGTEAGVALVVVSLYQDANNDGTSDGAALATDTTDANGYYLFENLAPGRYVVGVDVANFGAGQPLLNFVSSTPTFANNVDGNDNGINVAVAQGILSNSVLLTTNNTPINEADLSNNPLDGPAFFGNNGETDNNSDLTIDFGFVVPMSLGNRVWADSGVGAGGVANDGVQNGTEPGIANVVVSLYADANNDGVPDGAAIATDTTDANGYYLFGNLTPGRYIVGVDAANFNAGQPLVGLSSSTPTFADNVDRNDNGINLAAPQGILSNSILLTPNGAPAGETDLSNNAADGPVFRGNNGESDSNSDLTIDFGFATPPMSLGNRVWLDTGVGGGVADDGVQNGTELGIANVAVSLYADANNDGVPDGAALRADVTDANGYYLFDGLAPGRYIVGVNATNFTGGGALVSFASSTPNFADNVDQNDNGINSATPATTGILSNSVLLAVNTTPVGEADLSNNAADGPAFRGNNGETDANSDLTIDFGFFRPSMSLGNRVWLDNGAGGGVLNDGILNGGEVGVANVAVSLYADADNNGVPDGAALRADVTDANGYYLFDGLAPGRYIVGVDFNNFQLAGALVGLNSSTPTFADNVDSNDNGINVGTVQGILSNSVLLVANNAPINEGDLSNNAADGPNFRGNNGETDNNSDLTIDFGFIPNPTLMSLGNRVWFDVGTGGGVADNGIQDGGELGVAGVVVSLYADANNDGVPDGAAIRADTTDANGFYLFDGLAPGGYVVGLNATNFQPGGALVNGVSSTPDFADAVDRNDNGINNAAPAVNGILSNSILLTANATPVGETDLSNNAADGPAFRGNNGETDNNSDLTVDFGVVVPLYSLGNRVWRDVNNNGLIDGPDGAAPGIGGVTVRLFYSTGTTLLGTTTTDVNGYYRFDNLPAGTYIVEVGAVNFGAGQPLNGLVSSTPDELDANADVDSNDNGLGTTPNPGTGIRSSPVQLGPPGPAEPTGSTDLGPGDAALVGNGRTNLTVDFGFTPPPATSFSLGNRVWLDGNDNGQIDLGEPGVGNVLVRLFDATGTNLITTTTTNALGYYRFDNLPPADYIVEIAASNFAAGGPLFVGGVALNSSTPDEALPNTDGDSNDNGVGTVFDPVNGIRSGTVTLGPTAVEPTGEGDLGAGGQGAPDAQANMTVDFGFIGTAVTYSLGNRVWADTDNNGRIDAGEPGLGGVRINLLDALGNVLTFVTTDGNGYYRFDNLPAGNYLVEVDATNFAGGGALAGRSSSTGLFQEANPNSDVDSNDNGIDTPSGTGGIRSGVVTLGPGASEPLAEGDLGPGGQGAADDFANMTVDFGFIGSPPSATPAPPSGPSVPVRVDPIIGKIVTPPFGLPGDLVNWTITVTNPSSVPLNNVGFTDPVPGELEIIRTSVNGGTGTVTVNGQTVTYIINVLNPGQSVVVVIVSRVRQGVTVPFDISNTATLSNGYVGSGSDHIISATSLPATGEPPWWRLPLLLLAGGLVLVTGAHLMVRRVKRSRAGE